MARNGWYRSGWVVVMCLVPVFAKSITVLSPNGGERFAVGDTMVIRWESVGVTQANVSISFNAGERFRGIGGVSEVEEGWQAYVWVIPDTLFRQPTVSESCLVRVGDYHSPTMDESAAFFVIGERGSVTPPTGAEPVAGSGCGSGAGLALVPLVVAAAASGRRRLRQEQ